SDFQSLGCMSRSPSGRACLTEASHRKPARGVLSCAEPRALRLKDAAVNGTRRLRAELGGGAHLLGLLTRTTRVTRERARTASPTRAPRHAGCSPRAWVHSPARECTSQPKGGTNA